MVGVDELARLTQMMKESFWGIGRAQIERVVFARAGLCNQVPIGVGIEFGCQTSDPIVVGDKEINSDADGWRS